MSSRLVGPFNRVEGDLEIRLDIADDKVKAAYVNSPLFRGFEHILLGKHPSDALTITPRICGICSVSQSVATARALADAMGLVPARNGHLLTNLILATENMADHLTHFYLFFMPDFARDGYQGRPWFGDIQQRFKAVTGTAREEVLPARANFMHLMGMLAGKWPHTLGIQPGGASLALESSHPLRIRNVLREFRRFLERTLFGDALENIAALNSRQALEQWMAKHSPHHSDFRRFLEVATDLQLDQLGAGAEHFMSYGSYPLDGEFHFATGQYHNGVTGDVDLSKVTEDISHAWMAGPDEPLHPELGQTVPVEEKEGAYSWCKAPRLGNQIMEVGAMARQIIDGQSLIRDLLLEQRGNVMARVVARLLEMARVVPMMEQWADQFVLADPFCVSGQYPQKGHGIGTTEAARGSLGHWLELKNGTIHRYQIIAPTTWNFSPRDLNGRPGSLEQALQGVDAGGEGTPLAVQHIVRSFDPCMVCTVH